MIAQLKASKTSSLSLIVIDASAETAGNNQVFISHLQTLNRSVNFNEQSHSVLNHNAYYSLDGFCPVWDEEETNH